MVDPCPVKMCLCAGISFKALKAEKIESVDDARERFGCAQGCGMCEVYIEMMLESGKTEFPILRAHQF
ncbi:MAG: hypothetical protein JNM85_11235 [Chthonomonas sp.]|nr:hypothetical protein [Chthonomonas sp.]